MASAPANSICRLCVCISNTTDSPILLKSGEQLCQVWHILPVEASTSTPPFTTCICSAASPSLATCEPFSPCVILDPDGCLDQDTHDKFIALNLEFDNVFNPSISKYNGASGKIEAVVNIGPPFLLNAKAGFHSATGTPLRNYKTTLMSSKLLASLQNLSSQRPCGVPEHLVSRKETQQWLQARDILRRSCPVQQVSTLLNARC